MTSSAGQPDRCSRCKREPQAPGRIYCQRCLDEIAERRRRGSARQWKAIVDGQKKMRDWSLASFPADDAIGAAAVKAVEPWLWVHTGHLWRNGAFVEVVEDVLDFDGVEYACVADEDLALGLFVWGGCGSGKSGLAWSLLRARIELGYDYEPPDEYPRFANVVELLDDAKAAMRDGDGGAPIRELYDAAVLVLDALGDEKPSEWARDAITALVQRRHARGLPTIVTSNFSPSRLAARLGEGDSRAIPDPLVGQRIVSRLTENCITVKLDRPDLRRTLRRTA